MKKYAIVLKVLDSNNIGMFRRDLSDNDNRLERVAVIGGLSLDMDLSNNEQLRLAKLSVFERLMNINVQLGIMITRASELQVINSYGDFTLKSVTPHTYKSLPVPVEETIDRVTEMGRALIELIPEEPFDMITVNKKQEELFTAVEDMAKFLVNKGVTPDTLDLKKTKARLKKIVTKILPPEEKSDTIDVDAEIIEITNQTAKACEEAMREQETPEPKKKSHSKNSFHTTDNIMDNLMGMFKYAAEKMPQYKDWVDNIVADHEAKKAAQQPIQQYQYQPETMASHSLIQQDGYNVYGIPVEQNPSQDQPPYPYPAYQQNVVG